MGTFAPHDPDTRRDYQESHPWIAYQLDLRNAPPVLWQMLGEAQSKCRHLLLSPLKPAVRHKMESLYLAKGAQASTAIEGNTLTLDQVEAAVRGDLSVPPSQEYLKQEVDNIIDACRLIEERVAETGQFVLTTELLCELNALVLRDLEVEAHVTPGAFRDCNVGVGHYRGAPPQDVEYLTGRMAEWLESEAFAHEGLDLRSRFVRMFCKAVAAHVYIAWIHPFGDGNGRTARLVEFGILTAAGIPTVAAHLLSNHYNLTRTAYYRHLQRSSEQQDITGFAVYAAEGFVDLLQEQLGYVHREVNTYAWENFVHETLRGHTPRAKRQRDLVIALGHRWPDAASRSELTKLTPEIAVEYAGKQSKTLTRDVNALVDLKLLARMSNGRFRARHERMFTFMPTSNGDPDKSVLLSMPDALKELEENPRG